MAPPTLKVGHRIGTEAESGKKKGKREISMHKYFLREKIINVIACQDTGGK